MWDALWDPCSSCRTWPAVERWMQLKSPVTQPSSGRGSGGLLTPATPSSFHLCGEKHDSKQIPNLQMSPPWAVHPKAMTLTWSVGSRMLRLNNLLFDHDSSPPFGPTSVGLSGGGLYLRSHSWSGFLRPSISSLLWEPNSFLTGLRLSALICNGRLQHSGSL